MQNKILSPKHFLFILSACLVVSCAKIPAESISLAETISVEGKRMHALNVSLVNKMFNEKREAIDVFIRDEYSPKFIEEFTKRLPADVDLKKELPEIMKSVVPKINERRDAMQNALEANRIKILEKLESDYDVYDEAISALKKLLESAVKLNEEKRKLFEHAGQLAGKHIDFEQLETDIDQFIISSGDWGQNIVTLNEKINQLLKK